MTHIEFLEEENTTVPVIVFVSESRESRGTTKYTSYTPGRDSREARGS